MRSDELHSPGIGLDVRFARNPDLLSLADSDRQHRNRTAVNTFYWKS